MSTIFVEKPEADCFRLKNTTGVALVQNQFTVLGTEALVACEAIADAAVGLFEDLDDKVFEIADFVTAEGTFATANAYAYWDPTTGKFSDTLTVGYYRIGTVYEAKAGGVVKVLGCEAYLVPADVADVAASVANITELAGRPFRKTVTLTAAAAGTAVPIVAAGEVTGSNKVFIRGFLLQVNGATAWTDSTGTVVTLQDTAASPVVAATFAKAQLTGDAILFPHSTGVTLADPIGLGLGLTAAKGLDIIADSNFDAGSNIVVTVWGDIATA